MIEINEWNIITGFLNGSISQYIKVDKFTYYAKPSLTAIEFKENRDDLINAIVKDLELVGKQFIVNRHK